AVAGKPGSRRCNAYVVGLGPTRQVVLAQAVAAWPAELVDQVVAHELGHVRLRHTARRLPLTLLAQLGTLAAAAAVLSFQPLLDWAGVASPGDPRSYPLLLVVGVLVALPARCLLAWRDRAQERAADRFALTLLERPDHFAAMLDRVAEESGTPRRLPWWRRLTASHPPVDERAASTLSLDFSPTGA
ncbi:MAG TPA: M48 family metalloprotease, partial [Acidimicrobiales bacterium]|nr:M48 family metalloprotease [Acidimicrobiales bacterium]